MCELQEPTGTELCTSYPAIGNVENSTVRLKIVIEPVVKKTIYRDYDERV